MKPRIELVYFPGCPNVEAARTAIRAALAAMSLSLDWREWNRDDAATPDVLRRYGSPTVLVNGTDVAPASSDGTCCRIYADKDRMLPAPSVESIRSALEAGGMDGKRDRS